MVLEELTAVEDAAAFVFVFAVDVGFFGDFRCCACCCWAVLFGLGWGLSTFPGFHLPVLGVFVAFPIVLAAEALCAIYVSAAIGASVSFFVFSIYTNRGFISNQAISEKNEGPKGVYLSSH